MALAPATVEVQVVAGLSPHRTGAVAMEAKLHVPPPYDDVQTEPSELEPLQDVLEHLERSLVGPRRSCERHSLLSKEKSSAMRQVDPLQGWKDRTKDFVFCGSTHSTTSTKSLSQHRNFRVCLPTDPASSEDSAWRSITDIMCLPRSVGTIA